MKINAEQLAQRLESDLGAGAVEGKPSVLQRYVIDGKQPTLICSPGAPEQVVAALRICSEADAAVIPWGGGTAMALGNPPRQADLVLTTNRLDRVIEHDHDNLTATVQSGLALAALQEVLAHRRQFLAIDAPHALRATVGGTIAANLNGARRGCYGSVRDLVIGMKVALASGEHIKAGGKVVKNVAGYDMCKLFVGSLGTLGIITEAILRMAPIPETAATVLASGALSQSLQLAEDIARSPLLPAAVVLLNPLVNAAQDVNWTAVVGFEGFAETVLRQATEAQLYARKNDLSSEIRRDPADSQIWDLIRDFPLQSDRLIYRVNVPRGSLAGVLNTLQSWKTADFQPAMVIDAAAGTLWLAAPANDGSAAQFTKLITLASKHHGHAIMLAALPDFKAGVDVWGPPPAALSLMREIKRQFDPAGMLNPGRFVAGL